MAFSAPWPKTPVKTKPTIPLSKTVKGQLNTPLPESQMDARDSVTGVDLQRVSAISRHVARWAATRKNVHPWHRRI